MGQLITLPQIKSMKGKTYCPYVGVAHKHTSHFSETDTCDICQETKLCRINCESPKSALIHRTCQECSISISEMNNLTNTLENTHL